VFGDTSEEIVGGVRAKDLLLEVSAGRTDAEAFEQAIEIDVAKESIMPESVLPSLAIFRKISPGCPSGYRPTVM